MKSVFWVSTLRSILRLIKIDQLANINKRAACLEVSIVRIYGWVYHQISIGVVQYERKAIMKKRD